MFVILEVHPVIKFKKSFITSELSNFLFFDTLFFSNIREMKPVSDFVDKDKVSGNESKKFFLFQNDKEVCNYRILKI